jgi:hypothetical protein
MGITIEQRIEHSTLKQPFPGSAFKSAGVYRVALPTAMSLYKLTASDGAGSRGEIKVDSLGRVTPWWFSYESHVVKGRDGMVTIRGVADVLENAKRAQGGLRGFLRSRGAVCHDWNAMTHLLVVALKRSVIGLMGTCSGQPVYDDPGLQAAHGAANLSFIGGEQQFFLQELRRTDVTVSVFGPAG